MPEYITDDIEISSDDSGREDSNEENSNEEISHQKIKYNIECVYFYIWNISSDLKLFMKYSYNLHNLHTSYGKVNFYSK